MICWNTDLIRQKIEETRDNYVELRGMLRLGACAYETAKRERDEFESAIRCAVDQLHSGSPDAAYAVLSEALLWAK